MSIFFENVTIVQPIEVIPVGISSDRAIARHERQFSLTLASVAPSSTVAR